MSYSYRSSRASMARRHPRSRNNKPNNKRGNRGEYIDPSRVIKVATATEAAAQANPAAADLAYTGTGFRSMTGRGVQATVNGHDIAVGGPNMLKELGLDTPTDIRATVQEWVDRGASVLHIICDGAVIGAVRLEDKVREESRTAVKALQARGVKVAMITRQMLSAVSSGRMPLWRSTSRRIMSASRAGRNAEPVSCVCFTEISRSMMSPRSIRSPCMDSSIRSISRRRSASDGVPGSGFLAMKYASRHGSGGQFWGRH
jgi:hypothetical protein